MRRVLVLLAVLMSLPLLTLQSQPASAGGCDEVKSGSGETQIFDTFLDAFLCPIPLRYGRHDPGGWGKYHIDDRCSAGATNHCWDQAARDRTAAAVASPNLKCVQDRRTRVHHAWFDRSGKTYTQTVVISVDGYPGLGPRGIITSYYQSRRITRCR